MKNIKKLTDGIYSLDSGKNGPILSILGGVHGDETCGIGALDLLKGKLQITRGKIFFIYGNLGAIKIRKRQTQQNLNRMFQTEDKYSKEEKESYEYKRAETIKKYLVQSEASLDLHSSPSEGSPAFIICEKNAQNIIKSFPFKKVCYGFDDIEPGGTDFYMNSIGKVGICVECGNHNAAEAGDNALLSTNEFLKYYGMIDGDGILEGNIKDSLKTNGKKEFYAAKKGYITQTDCFKISRKFRDFEKIEKGQIIGKDGGKKILAENNGRILFARNRNKIGVEGFIEIIIQ